MSPPHTDDPAGRLARIPTRRMRRRLYRCVPFLAYQRGEPPTFLYTSGRPNRWNPRGVRCLYFSETEATADAEYRRAWRATAGEDQPKLVFRAEVRLRRIVDLEKPRVRRALGLCGSDLAGGWRLEPRPTRPQEIGRALSLQTAIAAVRFPSAAMRRSGDEGWNVAIYPDALSGSDRVVILGNTEQPLEELPRSS